MKNLRIQKSIVFTNLVCPEYTHIQRKLINAIIYIVKRTGRIRTGLCYNTTYDELKQHCFIKTNNNRTIKKDLLILRSHSFKKFMSEAESILELVPTI